MNLSSGSSPVAEILERCSKRPPDEMAWQEFVRRYHLTIRGSVIRAYQHKATDEAIYDLSLFDKAIDDLVQVVYCRLVESRNRLLNQFYLNQTGSIYRYLALVSYRVVFSNLREAKQLFRGDNT